LHARLDDAVLRVNCSQFYPGWFQFVWKNYKVTSTRKSAPPHDYVIAKGSAHMAATRAFVRHALTDSKARDLLDWMSDIKIPDEHFFQTLNHNPQLPAPGAFPGARAQRDCLITGCSPQHMN